MSTDNKHIELDLENEEWRVCPVLPPSIEVSTEGRLREYVNPTDWIIVEPNWNNGYKTFSCKGKSFPVSRLVALTFVPNPEGHDIVRHLNGIKDDNRASNLVWASRNDNASSSYSRGKRNTIYCAELDEVYGSSRTASYLIKGIHPELIARSLKEGCSVFGLTFKYVSPDDPLLDNHNVLYLSYEDMMSLVDKCESMDQLCDLARKQIGGLLS